MNWELYEVWAVDIDGHEDLIDTSKDLKEARQLGIDALDDVDIIQCIIYRETSEGDMEEIEVIER